jgi:ribosomal protein S18 acetylase RimI-like enzyme
VTEAVAHYTVEHSVPSVQTYRHIREASGLSPKTIVAAERGLPNTLFGVQVFFHGEPVGMGRVIGDGGAFYQVVDIAVLPGHQGRGLGKRIMEEIASYIAREVPESGYVSLIADGQAYQLYQQFGFDLTAPESVGMALKNVQWKGPNRAFKPKPLRGSA